MSGHYKYQKQNIGQNMGGAEQPQNTKNPYYRPQDQSSYGRQGYQRGQGGYMQQNFDALQNPYCKPQDSTFGDFLPKGGFNIFGDSPSDKLLRGILIGGVAAYLLTNENAQKTFIKTGVRLYGALAGGLEEFKEKIMDAKAELETEKAEEEL